MTRLKQLLNQTLTEYAQSIQHLPHRAGDFFGLLADRSDWSTVKMTKSVCSVLFGRFPQVCKQRFKNSAEKLMSQVDCLYTGCYTRSSFNAHHPRLLEPYNECCQ